MNESHHVSNSEHALLTPKRRKRITPVPRDAKKKENQKSPKHTAVDPEDH